MFAQRRARQGADGIQRRAHSGQSEAGVLRHGFAQLELTEPDHHPSTWRESLDKNGEGPHHVAFVIKGMKEKIAVLERNQMSLLQTGEYPGGRYAYIDTLRDLKVITELLENDE